MLGTSARVGEYIGLRRKDVDMTTSSPNVVLDGMIMSTKKQGLHRKAANWTRWYKKNVPLADDLFDQHIRRLREE